MDVFSDIPTYCWLGWGLLFTAGASSLIVQVLTLAKLNLSAVYFGSSLALMSTGFLFGSHEFGRAVTLSASSTEAIKQHIILADGAAVAITLICFFSVSAMVLGLFGAVLAYAREWIYRQELT